jgi:hypothetical protein
VSFTYSPLCTSVSYFSASGAPLCLCSREVPTQSLSRRLRRFTFYCGAPWLSPLHSTLFFLFLEYRIILEMMLWNKILAWLSFTTFPSFSWFYCIAYCISRWKNWCLKAVFHLVKNSELANVTRKLGSVWKLLLFPLHSSLWCSKLFSWFALSLLVYQ